MLAGAVAFLAYLISVAALLRRSEGSPAKTAILMALALYPPALLLAGVALGRAPFWAFSASYWFLTLCFLMVFGAVYKSLSLRMLLDLLEAPGRSSAKDELFARYIRDVSYRHRLEVIQESGFATRTGEGFTLTERGRGLARIIATLQRAFAIERSG
jgi:hypothetical protein